MTTVDFKFLKQEQKYFDLQLVANNHTIKVHKLFLSIKSQYIDMRLRREETWPPIHELTISLPDNIDTLSFEEAINIIYGIKKDNYQNILTIIDALIFLLVSNDDLLVFMQQVIPIDKELTEEHRNIVLHILDHDKSNIKLIEFYGKEIIDNINDIEDLDKLIPFDANLSLDSIKERYERQWRTKKTEYIPSVNTQWLHFRQVKCKTITFEALGIKWNLDRWLHSFDYDDNEDMIKLYVDQSCDIDIELKLRATFIIYTEKSRQIEIVEDTVKVQEYKLVNMRYGYKQNKLGCTVNEFGEKRVRISLIMEQLL